jgi:hypothetical protein
MMQCVSTNTRFEALVQTSRELEALVCGDCNMFLVLKLASTWAFCSARTMLHPLAIFTLYPSQNHKLGVGQDVIAECLFGRFGDGCGANIAKDGSLATWGLQYVLSPNLWQE